MKIEQVYNFVNTATKEILGETALVAQDLSNIVDVGTSIGNAVGYDAFYKSLVNQIGKMYFVNRPYKGVYANLFIDGWRFGSIVGKTQGELMDAQEDPSWNIINGASYDPWVVNLPVVSQKFYNKMDTFRIKMSTPRAQIEQSFKSADEMNRFLSMLETMVNNSIEVKLEALARACVNNLIGATIAGNNSARVVKLLTAYNGIAGTSLTPDKALLDKDFLAYATGIIMDYKDFLRSYTTLLNEGGKARHTPEDLLHFVALSTFATRCKTNLRSNTFHDDLVKLTKYEEVPFWQGTGTSLSLADRSTIKADVVLDDGTTASVNQANIVAVMFDDEACGILQPKREVDTDYNKEAKFYQSWHDVAYRYFNDFNENCVVFLLA